MSFYRHEKEKRFVDSVFKCLDNKYNGNIIFYKQAEQDVREQEMLATKLKRTALFAKKQIFTDRIKYTHFDFDKELISTVYADNNINSILSINLDYLYVQKTTPFPMRELINKGYASDNRKQKTNANKGKLNLIEAWIKNRSDWNIQLQNCTLDRKNRTINYVTSIQARGQGSYTQTANITINKTKKIDIPGYKKLQYMKDACFDYKILFNYFMLLDCSEIYFRCNCPEFNRKKGTHKSGSNYMCPHLMFSMSQLPYYTYYLLGRS